MLKLVSWIDSLPRLGTKRKDQHRGHGQKRRFELKKAKSTASTPWSGKNSKKCKNSGIQTHQDAHSGYANPNLAIKAIGHRRHTEPDAFQGTELNIHSISPAILSPTVCVSTVGDTNFMSASWHPDGIDRAKSLNHGSISYHQSGLISFHAVSCSVQDVTPVFSNDEMTNYTTLPSIQHRPQIRTNPWIRPKSPRVVPALDLSRSGSLLNPKTNSTMPQSKGTKDDASVYSLRSSSGYGSGASQDSSPASSVHTPDWQHFQQCDQQSSQPEVSREDVALQCDMTVDKSVACTEEDFQYFQMDENGNIPMIDEESEDSGDDQCDCASIKSPTRADKRLSKFGNGITDNSDKNVEPQTVLSVLNAKVEQLKASGDQVTEAVRTAKEEQKRRNGEMRLFEEQMQFLKQLKLVISNGFEVLV